METKNPSEQLYNTRYGKNKKVEKVFNLVGMIINEYAPGEYKSDVFRKDYVWSIQTDATDCLNHIKEYKNLKSLVANEFTGNHLFAINGCSNLEKLSLEKFSSLYTRGILNPCKKLRELNIPSYTGDLSNLQDHKLVVLCANKASHIPYCSTLKYLLCDRPSFFNDSIGRCAELEVLHNNTLNTDFSTLHMCTKLKKLSISYYKGPIQPFTMFEQLRHLDICRGIWKKCTSRVLDKLDKLISLEVSEVFDYLPVNIKRLSIDKISDTKFMKSCTNLEGITITNHITDITFLKNCTNLQYLNMTLPPRDLTPISQLYNLRFITLQRMFGDLKPLALLENLEYLDLEGYTGDTLEPLKNMKKIRVFRATTTYDVSYLQGCPNIKLYITDNIVCTNHRYMPYEFGDYRYIRNINYNNINSILFY